MSKRYLLAMILFIAVCGFMIGCGKNEDSSAPPNNSDTQNPPAEQQQQQPAPPAEQPKPAESGYTGGKAEVTLFDHNSNITELELEEHLGKLLKAKYPDITVTKLSGKLNDLISSGTVPDLVMGSNAIVNQYLAADFPQDLSEMIKKYNIDTGLFGNELMKAVKDFGKDGSIIGLPFADNSSALLYNQDLFDKFGLEFPNKDIITLEDYVELIRVLTRKEGDVQYIGGNVVETNVMVSSGLNYIDPNDKNKALLSTDQHKYVWSLLQKVYQIPNYIGENGVYRHGADLFWKDGIMAMNWTWVGYPVLYGKDANFNWDIHSQPVIWKDNPTANSLDFHLLMVSKVSKNKEAAYAVVEHMLSKEIQIRHNRLGRLTSYTDMEIRKDFAKDSGVFEGKNLANVFLIGPTPLWPFTDHIGELDGAMKEVARQLALEGTDLNTAIRNAEDLANQKIKEKLASK